MVRSSHDSVAMVPGATALLRIPFGPKSTDRVFVKLISAAFAAE